MTGIVRRKVSGAIYGTAGSTPIRHPRRQTNLRLDVLDVPRNNLSTRFTVTSVQFNTLPVVVFRVSSVIRRIIYYIDGGARRGFKVVLCGVLLQPSVERHCYVDPSLVRLRTAGGECSEGQDWSDSPNKANQFWAHTKEVNSGHSCYGGPSRRYDVIAHVRHTSTPAVTASEAISL